VIAALRNQTAEPEETLAALEALRILVEPIDLANGAPSGPAGLRTWRRAAAAPGWRPH
jgi:hypothetical protein